MLFSVRVGSFGGKPSPGTCPRPELGHLAPPSCKRGWKCEDFAFKPRYCRKAGKKIRMNKCCEPIVFVQLTLHREQMIVISVCGDSQETSLDVLLSEVLQ